MSQQATAIPQALKLIVDGVTNRPIVELELSRNALGVAGADALSDFLASCPSLKLLNVDSCGLGPEGAISIAASLLKCEGQRLEVF